MIDHEILVGDIKSYTEKYKVVSGHGKNETIVVSFCQETFEFEEIAVPQYPGLFIKLRKFLKKSYFYRSRSEGDNALGSVRLSVRLFALSRFNRLTYDLRQLGTIDGHGWYHWSRCHTPLRLVYDKCLSASHAT